MRSSSNNGWRCRSALLPSLHGSTGGWHRGSGEMEPPRHGSGREVSSGGGSGGLDPGGGGSMDLTIRSPPTAGSTASNAAAAGSMASCLSVGAADYIAIARNYHTIFISEIPAMSMKIRDKARRFITLIDELYNHHCRLICLSASSIDDLFQGTEEGPLFDLESFQFETESEGTKLRRDVLAEGNVGLGPSTTGLVAILSGQEEMFAFCRAPAVPQPAPAV
ncbi:unnamed protein product [Miscanthus lutarioriparius]|uniref:AFG1-like ATPase family protein n=1 Tax=Miscanthus lutarioriparius TaxID=422564 RepID=A0A811RYN1_9POAL|nr:unnamed protein product [Miscanthus lutarioriparius]